MTEQVLGGYVLHEVAGWGAVGQVYRATDPRGGQVAVKVLRPELAHDPDVLRRFLRERSILAGIDHPRVVKVRRLREAGAEVVAVTAEGGWVSLAELLGCLAARGVVSLLMEGGATLAGSFAAAGLIDRYLFYVAPKLLGGGSAPGVLEGWSVATIGEARPLVLRGTRRMGEDLRLEARPREGAV
jgi:diaminohydroxyphosphoribosylaminopyrimidine deaminase/5-amino-6-(5-phosphoribosylamino)uracil reductase